MELSQFIKEFEPHFQAFLRAKQSDYKRYTKNKIIRDYVSYLLTCAQGGKRVRPYVAYLTYGNSGKAWSSEIMPYLVSIEAIHLFLLIHDDVMDKGLTRRGQATSQVYIEQQMKAAGRQGDVPHVANMQAVLIGDLLMWSSFEPLHQAKTKPAIKLPVLEKFHQLIDEVGLGQMLDVDMTTRLGVSDKEIAEKIKKKSALYTFTHPMQIGALLGGEPQSIVKQVGDIGEAIGMAFQIQDDLLDAIGDPKKTKKPVLNDIKEGQHTYLSQYILKNGTSAERKLLTTYWRRPIPKNKIAAIQAMLESSGAASHARKLAKRYFTKARKLIAASDLKPATQTNLVNLIELLEKRNT